MSKSPVRFSIGERFSIKGAEFKLASVGKKSMVLEVVAGSHVGDAEAAMCGGDVVVERLEVPMTDELRVVMQERRDVLRRNAGVLMQSGIPILCGRKLPGGTVVLFVAEDVYDAVLEVGGRRDAIKDAGGQGESGGERDAAQEAAGVGGPAGGGAAGGGEVMEPVAGDRGVGG